VYKGLRIGVVLPARDEALAIPEVISTLVALRNSADQVLLDAVVVCDNGSRDNTAELARAAGAVVISEAQAGYGRACLKAISALPKVDVLLFVDADRSVVPEQCLRLLEEIAAGRDLVLGARTLGRCEAGALTPPQIFGNALAVFLIRLLWGARFADLGPFRAIRYEAYQRLQMQDQSYGWTVEMQVKAMQMGLSWTEVPVDTRCRLGRSKISGTVRGVIGAGMGILGMVARLWLSERRRLALLSKPV
jgi:glycosyltransferase involved in cell wall biosynthesis